MEGVSFLYDSSFLNTLINFNLNKFEKLLFCSNCMDLYQPVKLLKAWNRHTRWSLETVEWCSEDTNITIFSKILLKFAIVFKIFENFCPFLSLTITTDQRSFLSLADGLHEKNSETKNVFDYFLYCKMWKKL